MKMTSTKRFAVRTALVTSTTLATIVGAQALASLDAATFSPTPQAVVAPAEANSSAPALSFTTHAPATAPNIVILRHAGQASSATTTNSQANTGTLNAQPIVIQPPSPVQVTVPQPVPQTNAPVAARTRSTR